MLNYDTFPAPHMIHAVRDYIEHGIPPGSFLTAVLRNDLKEAVARADDINSRLLCETVRWLYNEAPFQCWGAPEAMAWWIREREHARRLAALHQPETNSPTPQTP